MTEHYFENSLVNLHYYKYGSGDKKMLCFHGYGMHGKQFKIFEHTLLGLTYTFYGFDLFFHKQTKLKDQGLAAVKKGISKKELADLVSDFCEHEQIERFSVIGYSMGTHYATAIVEELPRMVEEYAIALSCLNPGKLIAYFSKNKTGNKILEKLVLHKRALTGMLKLFRRLRFISKEEYKILFNEIGTEELRFNFYACFIYLRFLETDEALLLQLLEERKIKSILIFGERDKSFPPGIGKTFIAKLKQAEVVILNEGHELIKRDLVSALTQLLC